MATRTATATPSRVGTPPDDSVTVTNLGAAPLYLGEEQSVSPEGFALNFGDSVTWDAGRPLWVVCDTGRSTSYRVVNNGGFYVPAGDTSRLYVKLGSGNLDGTLGGGGFGDSGVDVSPYGHIVIVAKFRKSGEVFPSAYGLILHQSSGSSIDTTIPAATQASYLYTKSARNPGSWGTLWRVPVTGKYAFLTIQDPFAWGIAGTWEAWGSGRRLDAEETIIRSDWDFLTYLESGGTWTVTGTAYDDDGHWFGAQLGLPKVSGWSQQVELPTAAASARMSIPWRGGGRSKARLHAYIKAVTTVITDVDVVDVASGNVLAHLSLPAGTRPSASVEFIAPRHAHDLYIENRTAPAAIPTLQLAMSYSGEA